MKSVREDDEPLRVRTLVDDAIAGWRACGEELPDLGRRYSRAEQGEREAVADECLSRVDALMGSLRRRKIEAAEAQARITEAVVELTSCALDVKDAYVDWLLGDRFGSVSTGLAREARRMDYRVSVIDILQAARNAWTACGLQAVLGRAVGLTPAIFAYSMLYPYSDNYLDNGRVGRAEKLRFSGRFRRRLAGERLRAEDAREAVVWRLVETIEGDFGRGEFPQVYAALLAIHAAQERSIGQTERGARDGELDVLELTFEKGGTSVLADGCLAAGRLTEAEAAFVFRWGVVLQLGDDLQDVRADGERGSWTLFTREVGRGGRLHGVTNRTLQFGRWAMAGMEGLAGARPELRELLRRSSQLLLVRSAAGAAEWYSPEYLRELEAYSPFRFEYLRERERALAERKREYGALFESLIRDPEGARGRRKWWPRGSGSAARSGCEAQT